MKSSWKKRVEDVSFKVTILSALLIFIGLLAGSFVKYTILLASIGVFILLLSIILYAISQLGD